MGTNLFDERFTRSWLLGLGCALATALGCGHGATTAPLAFDGGAPQRIAGLAACSPSQPSLHEIDPDEPLVVLVHGCYSSGGRFRSLADVFELHGQQTLCFNYDYRDSLAESGAQLRAALGNLRQQMNAGRVTVIGHSQGGLVARAALSGAETAEEGGELQSSYRLVTVSSPFAGIEAASDCGSIPMHIASLGITVAICQIVTGSNWNEIHPGADMVLDPSPLSPAVVSHLTVVTDERETCRRRARDGGCEESDFVFAVAEQDNPRVLEDPRVQRDQVHAGHVEIVGGSGTRPRKLIEALQRHGIMAPTPPEKRRQLAQLLRRLF